MLNFSLYYCKTKKGFDVLFADKLFPHIPMTSVLNSSILYKAFGEFLVKIMESRLKNAVAMSVCVIFMVASAFYLTNFGGWQNMTTTSTTPTTTTTTTTTSTTSTTTTTLTTPAYAKVFGIVSTTGYGTYDTVVVFTSSQERYVSPIMNGSFSAELPNPGTYNVTTVWKGLYPWQNGTIYKG